MKNVKKTAVKYRSLNTRTVLKIQHPACIIPILTLLDADYLDQVCPANRILESSGVANQR